VTLPYPELRDYQVDVSGRGRRRMAGGRRGIIQGETGSGKSILIGYLTECAYKKGSRVLILADRRRLVKQLGSVLDAFRVPYGVIMSGETGATRERVILGSRDTFVAWVKGREVIPFDLILIDECFPAGTIVDGRPIETIRVGDEVTAFDEATGRTVRRRVVRTFDQPAPNRLVTITVGCASVTATTNHPFWTSRGWVNAGDIQVGDDVYGLFQAVRVEARSPASELSQRAAGVLVQSAVSGGVDETAGSRDLPSVRVAVHGNEERPSWESEIGRPGVLLADLHQSVLCRGVGGFVGKDEPEVGVGKDEGQQSDAPGRSEGETFGVDEGSRAQAAEPRRERSRHDGPGTDAGDGDQPKAVRRPDWSSGERLPDQLQDRSCRPDGEIGSGDRWRESQQPEGQGCGSAKGRVLSLARVDRVEVHERAGDGGLRSVCSDGRVYNLEVEGEHTYLANGFAVHNCHKALASTYQAILACYPKAFVIGFTATPARDDGRSMGDFFQWLECTVPASRLIADGWLIKPEVFAPVELASKRKRGEGKGLTGDPVSHWRRHADGLPTIAFASNRSESLGLRDLFLSAGIPAEHIDAEVSDDARSDGRSDRDDFYDRLANGATKILCSVGLLVEGVDIPEVSAAILWSKFGSVVKFRQACGRTMRPCPRIGKTRSVILDHAGAAGAHGLPGEDVEWSLDLASTVGERRKKAEDDGRVAKTVICKGCGFAFAELPACPNCGKAVPRAERKRTAAQEFEAAKDEILTRFDGDEARSMLREQQQRHWLRAIYAAVAKGGTAGMAAAIFRTACKVNPWEAGVEPLTKNWKGPARDEFPSFVRGRAE
jgi:superfamily II DNA or RNA helicase